MGIQMIAEGFIQIFNVLLIIIFALLLNTSIHNMEEQVEDFPFELCYKYYKRY